MLHLCGVIVGVRDGHRVVALAQQVETLVIQSASRRDHRGDPEGDHGAIARSMLARTAGDELSRLEFPTQVHLRHQIRHDGERCSDLLSNVLSLSGVVGCPDPLLPGSGPLGSKPQRTVGKDRKHVVE